MSASRHRPHAPDHGAHSVDGHQAGSVPVTIAARSARSISSAATRHERRRRGQRPPPCEWTSNPREDVPLLVQIGR